MIESRKDREWEKEETLGWRRAVDSLILIKDWFNIYKIYAIERWKDF